MVPVQKLREECFGGKQKVTTWDSYHRRQVKKDYDRVRNAYMLIYERIVPLPTPLSSSSSSPPPTVDEDDVIERTRHGVPVSLYNQVWNENGTFLRDRLLFDRTYFDFLYSLSKVSVGSPTQGSFGVERSRVGRGGILEL